MICSGCYRDAPPGSAYCPRCGARLAADRVAAPAISHEGSGGGTAAWANPWEQRGGRGAVGAFAETLQQALFRPTAFFRATAPDTGAGAALWFAVIVGTLSSLVAALWVRAMSPHLRWGLGGSLTPLVGDRAVGVGFLALAPLEIVIWCVLLAALHHTALAVIGGARGTYGTTLKAVCYSTSAISFIVFPACGLPVAMVWMVVTLIVGLRELHRTSTARAFWAWALPYFVFFCVAGAAVSSLMFAFAKFWQEFVAGRFEV